MGCDNVRIQVTSNRVDPKDPHMRIFSVNSQNKQRTKQQQSTERSKSGEAMVPADPRTAVCHDETLVVMRHVDAGIEHHQPGSTTTEDRRQRLLHLAMLSCENQPPYGPSQHTAQLFLDLLTLAVQKAAATRQDLEHNDKDHEKNDLPTTIQIQIFDTQAGVYPDDWDRFDGFLLPGSFSSAYDTDAWIETL